NGINWKTIISKSLNVPQAGKHYSEDYYEYPLGASARHLRLLCEDGGTVFSKYKAIELVEVEVIEKN
ncbi:MAG: hypothetical protein KKA81_17260, partial [Bacteroidetes bacterium]|nr:hypothetical protein [Bacteroidota bacterium]